MLILSRKLNESIVIDGRIIVKVLRIEKDTVKLGIQAPIELSVHRQEIYEAIQRSKQAAAGAEQAGNSRPPHDSERQTPETPPGNSGGTGNK
jgi:carbon storage regulator